MPSPTPVNGEPGEIGCGGLVALVVVSIGMTQPAFWIARQAAVLITHGYDAYFNESLRLIDVGAKDIALTNGEPVSTWCAGVYYATFLLTWFGSCILTAALAYRWSRRRANG